MKIKTNIATCMLIIALVLVGCSSNTKVSSIENNGAEKQSNEGTNKKEQADVNNDEQDNSKEASSSKGYHGKEGKITIYLSGPEAMLDKIEKEFETDNGDVLDLVKLGCGPLRQKVWTEKQAGQIQADIVWGSDPLLYQALKGEGDLVKYIPKDFEMIQEKYQVGDSFYTIVNERYAVVAYNKDKLKEDKVPKSFEDLKQEEYKGSLVMANANYSSTALAITSGLYQMSGNNWDYIKALKENNLFFAKSNGQVPSKIQEGEFDVGIAPHDSIIRLKKKAKKENYKTPIEMCWPKEGALAIQRPIAIIKDDSRPSANQNIAEKFVDFMISKKVQTITTGMGFVSVRNDVPLPQGIPSDIQTKEIDWRFAYENESILRDGVKEIMGE
ncbi:MAG: extracellular solute-binding protein [Vallitalea sp.]|jgi:iron(III) transport system substrate-binding protein|nr:extracellular solute-binding protein [Vallitalea sp.]